MSCSGPAANHMPILQGTARPPAAEARSFGAELRFTCQQASFECYERWHWFLPLHPPTACAAEESRGSSEASGRGFTEGNRRGDTIDSTAEASFRDSVGIAIPAASRLTIAVMLTRR